MNNLHENWNQTRDSVPSREEIGRRVVFVKNPSGDIQSTKVSPSEWPSCGFSQWIFADELMHSRGPV